MASEKIIRNPETNCEVSVSREEEKYRKTFPSFDETKNEQLKCTVCCVNMTHSIVAGKACHLHSFLKVLVCKKCLDFYGNGDFSTDEDGDEKYCRWCGQGGNLFLCDKCNSGFCKACVKRNFNRDVFGDLKKQDKWDCFMCNPKPLYELRAKAWAAEKHYLANRKEDKKSKNTTQEKSEPKVSKSRRTEDKAIKSEQKFIGGARKLLFESLDESKRLAEQCKQQSDKIQKTKVTKKHLKNAEDITRLESKIQSFFDSISENVDDIKSNLTKNLAEWKLQYEEHCQKKNEKCQENGKDSVEVGGEEGDKAKEVAENGTADSDREKEEKSDDGEKVDAEKVLGDVGKKYEKDLVEEKDDDKLKNDKEEVDLKTEVDLKIEVEEKDEEESKNDEEEEASQMETNANNSQDCNDTTLCTSELDSTVATVDSECDEPPAKLKKT